MPDQLDNVCDLATQMLFAKNVSQVVKETYSPELVRAIDQIDLSAHADLISIARAKIVLAGKDLLSKADVLAGLGEPLGPIAKDKYFKTVHRVFRKPTELALNKSLDLHRPQPNRFIPNNIASQV